MSIVKQVQEALRFLGVRPGDPLTPELAQKSMDFAIAQARIHKNHADTAIYFDRVTGSFQGWIMATFEQLAPPLRPPRDVFAEHLEELHIPNRATRGLRVQPGDHLLDFAYPASKVAIRIGDWQKGDTELAGDGWSFVRFTEDQIRRQPIDCAIAVRGELESTRERRRAKH